MAQAASSQSSTERLYQSALAWNPYDASIRFNFGLWLYLQRRAPEAISHLRFAVEHGLNASVCYAYLAAAEAGAGDFPAAERTLALAVGVYPRSVFLRVRHASALTEAGNTQSASEEYRAALVLNPRQAKGWRQLISFGRKTAKTVAFYDKGIAMPGELIPENCLFAVLDESERRQPVAVLDENSDLSAATR
jgi:Tfp pilus assembly protein PilF